MNPCVEGATETLHTNFLQTSYKPRCLLGKCYQTFQEEIILTSTKSSKAISQLNS